MDFIKEEVKMIVSNVISDFINTRTKLFSLNHLS
ncbi:MAG: hypothetical protein CM15mP36_16670 [Flavobacteriales bacterium]|nr:MAG: hypothetical protein CM15mP36_16670 [Flavobacteriales bacterium]